MDDGIDVSEAIRELDIILSQQDEKYILYACGGAALRLGDIENYSYFVNSYFEAIKKDLAYE